MADTIPVDASQHAVRPRSRHQQPPAPKDRDAALKAITCSRSGRADQASIDGQPQCGGNERDPLRDQIVAHGDEFGNSGCPRRRIESAYRCAILVRRHRRYVRNQRGILRPKAIEQLDLCSGLVRHGAIGQAEHDGAGRHRLGRNADAQARKDQSATQVRVPAANPDTHDRAWSEAEISHASRHIVDRAIEFPVRNGSPIGTNDGFRVGARVSEPADGVRDVHVRVSLGPVHTTSTSANDHRIIAVRLPPSRMAPTSFDTPQASARSRPAS